ncbi:MAG: TIR domain-containing protein [Polyangiaceae bacterium]|nr:TIR domain-containing protein [Polyangiaceae bacterium]
MPQTNAGLGADETFDAFLCHAGADKPAVRALAERLRSEGFSVWLDEEQIDPGVVILDAIELGLRASRHVFVCVSREFQGSKWARVEWQAALHRQIQLGEGSVVPVRVADGPDSDVPLFLASRRIEDVRVSEGFAKLVALLDATKGEPPPSRRKPTKPPRGPTREVRLTLTESPAGFEAKWIHAQGVGSPFVIAPPLTVEDRSNHKWYLEESLRWSGPGDEARARTFETRMEEIGKKLHKELRGDTDSHPLLQLATDGEHRLFTIVSDQSGPLGLPWELVHDTKGPLLLRDIILRRQLPASSTAKHPQVDLPLRILWIVSRPEDVSFLDPRSSLKAGLDALAVLGDRVEIEICTPPTLAEVERRLDAAKRANKPIHLVHFDGHGVYLPHLGVGALCFEKADQKNDLVPGNQFGALLSRYNVPVALLEACQTAEVTTSVFGSVAPALLQAGVGSVIAFSHAVTMSAARVLVRAMYEAICEGDTMGEALAAGRRAMNADQTRRILRGGREGKLRDWHIPQLYQTGRISRSCPTAGRSARSSPENSASQARDSTWSLCTGFMGGRWSFSTWSASCAGTAPRS